MVFDIIARLLHADVGEQAAIDAGGLRIARQAFESVTERRVEIGEKQQGDFGSPAYLGRNSEHFGKRGAGAQRAFSRLLDDGTVGDGVGEGHAQFDEIGAAAFERGDQFRGGLGRWIAGGQVGDHAAAVFPLQGFE